MIKFANWPHWLQLLVGIPHAILLVVMAYFWWPKTGKGLLWFFGLGAYLLLFYLVFVR
jgi:hypothetical protein